MSCLDGCPCGFIQPPHPLPLALPLPYPVYTKEHGYVTLGTGKTYHPGIPKDYDEPLSWSQDEPYYMSPNGYPPCKTWPGSMACPSDGDWEGYSDYLDMAKTAGQMEKYAPSLNTFPAPFCATGKKSTRCVCA